ncbi:MAG: elongation factor P [Patescibacteria group bacterium]
MAKVQYNDVLPKRTITIEGDPYLVLSSQISKKDRQKASNTVRVKNLRTGNVVEKTLHQSDVFEEAEMEKRDVKFLYSNRGEFWFCLPDNPRERFQLDEETVGNMAKFVKENSIIEAYYFNNELMSVLTPIKVELTVTEASEAVKGNTSSGATKEVVVETGLLLQAPQFINQGDIISINTETGQYSERIEKA